MHNCWVFKQPLMHGGSSTYRLNGSARSLPFFMVFMVASGVADKSYLAHVHVFIFCFVVRVVAYIGAVIRTLM